VSSGQNPASPGDDPLLARLRTRSGLSEDVRVSSQLFVLAGVIIGALASYLTTAATERARWKRALDSRWDDRRVEAYVAYAQAVKDEIRISGQLAAGRGVGEVTDLLSPTQENLDLLAAASAARGGAWETVLLLGHPETVAAARNWHESVWRLEWFARGLITGGSEDYEEARSATNIARSLFYESARRDLQVRGGGLPEADDFDVRLRRVRGDSNP
jgi:hypothetical protein